MGRYTESRKLTALNCCPAFSPLSKSCGPGEASFGFSVQECLWPFNMEANLSDSGEKFLESEKRLTEKREKEGIGIKSPAWQPCEEVQGTQGLLDL